MTRRGPVGRAMDKLLPWPAKSRRKAAITQARAARERAEASRDHAVRVSADIRRLAADNHFAESIAAQIAHGRNRGERA